MTDVLKTRAGRLLYRHLPEEYRYRDNAEGAEMGDLEAYLHGFGDLLDRLRKTLDQGYDDAFAEATDPNRESQTWILPYLASLIGTRLIAPDLDGTGEIRRSELNRAVGWSKGKGTLRVTDDVADVLADAETVVVEGWRRTATTPRLALPPFLFPVGTAPEDMVPLGTPDLRLFGRAVRDPGTANPLRSFRLKGRDADGMPTETRVFWHISHRRGAACFPGGYDDPTVTTPDIRSQGSVPLGPAPRRVTVHVQPAAGFFEVGLKKVGVTQAQFDQIVAAAQGTIPSVGPKEIMAEVEPAAAKIPDRITVTGALIVKAGKEVRLTDLNLMDPVEVEQTAHLHLDRVAARKVTVQKADDPALLAKDCLIGEIAGPTGFARLEYVTVLCGTQTGTLQASDCIFVGAFAGPGCFDDGSCIRYSRIPAGLDPKKCLFAKSRSNTDLRPCFVRRPLKVGDTCEVREAVFGKPGAGVLDLASPAAIQEGAEDGMEMGAFHHLGYAARLTALRRKLVDQLPLGQSLQLIHDPMLAVSPPELQNA